MMKDLFISRKFWVAILMLAVTIVSAFVPSFDLDADTAAGLAIVVVSYIVGVSIDPGPNGGTWRGVIQSRKFWAALVGFVIMILDGFGIGLPLGLTSEQLVLIAVTIGGYIAAVAAEQPPPVVVIEE